MNIYQLNDCDWWIGPSLDACKKDYATHFGDAGSIDDDAHELNEEELDALIFVDRETGIRRTFREQRVVELRDGGAFPRLFATTEF